jgi:hypothetical protein
LLVTRQPSGLTESLARRCGRNIGVLAGVIQRHLTRPLDEPKEAKTMSIPVPAETPDPNIDDPELPVPTPEEPPSPLMPPVIEPPVGDPPSGEPPAILDDKFPE